jgi:ribonuclease BN (tRNA processing enzyme)
MVRLTVLGGCGAWPAAGQACSGYLVEHDGFRLLIDPGYAIVPRLLQSIDADDVDAVLVSLARGADLLLAEASCPREVLGGSARYLSSALQAGQLAHQAGVGRLILTHLMPESSAQESTRAAAEGYDGPIAVASPGLVAGPGHPVWP